ncbi:MAG: D-alanyl-D-alanine carboxypeptidase [Hungatella sp.]|nr:D-alanyl-D-alanine carboxypeptidase [Hungatella sp.]
MKRLLSCILCAALLAGLWPLRAEAAPAWPDNISIQAEGGIVMDADTGTVLYGKNIHTAYYPASITKILTALIVIERCDLDEMVTFSHNAVYNVEAGSTSAGLDEGDVLSVRDCLYALLLRSANEAANALAEHVAGTTESFAELMNAKAASLGCQNSHFANPSGLNDPNHYTTAYDMALIGRAALSNDTFMEIDATLYYDLPVTRNNKEGLRIYPGHKMIKKNMPEYYSGALGGKTGYTSLAGNTLVTFARRDEMTLVAVVLNGHSTHYSDTKAMLNFGFRNFLCVSAAGFDTDFTSIENDMTIGGLSPTGLSGLELDPSMKITIPKDAVFSSVTSQLSYDLTEQDPPGSIARVCYYWDDKPIGFTYLTVNAMSPDQVMTPAALTSLSESSQSGEIMALSGEMAGPEDASSPEDSSDTDSLRKERSGDAAASQGIIPEGEEAGGLEKESSDRSPTDGLNTDASENIPEKNTVDSPGAPGPKQRTGTLSNSLLIAVGCLAAMVVLTTAGVTLFIHSRRREEADLLRRRQRRLERLAQSGISSDQFDSLVQKKRSLSTRKRQLLSQRFRNDDYV